MIFKVFLLIELHTHTTYTYTPYTQNILSNYYRSYVYELCVFVRYNET